MSAYRDADVVTLLRVEEAAQAALVRAMHSRREADIDRARAKVRAIRATIAARYPRKKS